ncbi:MAG: acetyltransferase [Lutibacter sp.]|nr:acetyltransferase [Lutibacter sp.]
MYIFGASGHGKVIASILLAKKRDLKGFIDDNPKATELMGLPVYRSTEIKNIAVEKIIIAIGDNKIRKQIAESFKADFFSVIHPSSVLCEKIIINKGTVVFPNAVINVDTVIGNHVIINSGAIIEHDCILEDFVHISPSVSIAGGVKVGEGTHIGIGTCVIPGITIGKWATIGAGSVIINEVPDFAVVVGNPAKIIKYNDKF